MKKRKVRVTNTGYLPNSPDRYNDMNIIPSNQITMKNVPFPIMGIDNLGNQQMMMPGGEYTFPGQYVTEIPMGKYQKGGLVKYQKKGQVSFDDYMMEGLRPRSVVQESTYRPVPIIEQEKKDDAKGVTTKQKVQVTANRKKIAEEEKKKQFEADLANQGEIKPATEGTERLKNQFIYAMDQPLDALGSLMYKGYVPQGNLNGNYETASPMSSVIGGFNPASILMDIGRVGRDAFEKETYTTWGGAGEGVMNAIGFLPFGNFLQKGKKLTGLTQIPISNDIVPLVNTTPTSWSMQEMPGLHLKSTMSGSPLEKQLSKTGEISRSNIIAHINKAETSAADKFTLQKVLDTKFPNQNKIDYNDFRKAVSDEAIELERKVLPNYEHNNWGVGRLGYPSAKRSNYEVAIKSGQDNIQDLERRLSGTIEPNPWMTVEDLEIELAEAKNKLAKNLSEYENLPLENVSITYENPTKFGRGNADHFDESTLGHARTLVSKEEPDIMHFLEQQSDYWQKLGKTKPIDLEKYEKQIARREAEYLEDLETLKKLKETKMDYAGNPKSDYEIRQFEDIVNKKGAELNLRKGDLFNPQQKEFLGKNYQERLLQENVKYAAEQGKSIVRFPTSETAAKIQGYEPIETKLKKGDVVKLPNGETGILNNEVLWDDFISVRIDGKAEQIPTEEFLKHNPKYSTPSYAPTHQTILKKYSEQPKSIKKLFGAEPRVVTDGKGNTWYEFDIPESFKQGKAEIKAFRLGGFMREESTTPQKKQGGMYLGKYEFKDGGLVKMAPGGVNPGRYSGKLTVEDFDKIVGQAPEPTETFIPFRNEEPSKNISEFMGKKTSVSRDLQNEKKIEDKVRKYESSSEFQLGQNVYRDPKTHINQYEKTADYKLRHKNISDYNSDDVKQIQKKLVDEGLIKSSQINLSDYKTEDDVKELQRFLVSQGLADHLGKYGENKDGVDGKLGKMTRAAVELYNKNNKGYDEGKLDDKTREAVKQFKAFSDAKKTTGVNIVDPFNLVDENGDPKIDETYSALQDYENQLNRSGYFKGNFKIDTSPITEYNKKIAYNFKINPDPTTPFGMCAQYVNGTVCREDVYGQDAREKLGFTGPAWHISDNIQNKGGSLLFAGLPERSTLKLKNKDEINAFVKNQLVKPETITALQSLVGDGNINSTSKVKPGDVVNIFYEGSSYAEEAYSQTAANNNRLFTTHVGIVKADDQGNLYVEHNIHGDVKKDPIGNFLTGKVKGNGRNKVSLISGITRPKYFNKVDANASLPIGGIEYYQTDEGQFNPEGVFATKDYLAQSVSGKQTYELLKTIEKNKKGLLKDIPITEGEFTKLLRVTRALPTLETYSKSQPLTQWEKDKKVLQDTFYKEKSMGITKLKDESNLGENLRKKLITSDEELDNPVKAALPTFYSLSKNYLYLKDVANKYKIDINTDELAKLAGISWNQSVSRIATELVKSGSYDDYVRYRESKAPDKKNFKYREVIDVYDTQTMRYGGTTQQQGIYLGKYEFKDGGLVKYQNKGEVDNTNVYINTNMYNDLYKNQELYRNMKNWDQPDVQEDSPYKSQYPLTYSLASGLKNVPRYKNTKTDDFFKLLNLIAAVESKDKNIPQMDGGPGRGYYQVEPPTATTAKNRAIQLQKDLKNYGYDLPLPEKFDTNFMNLSKDEQAFYALSNIIKAASAKRENDPNYNIDFTNPGKAWIELHWAGKDSIKPDRVEHWNEINKDNKIALDENGNVILVKKQGGLVKAQRGLNKRMIRQYPGMKNVYGDRGENLNIIKDKNFIPSEYGYGDIEFIYPGSGLVTYNDQYSYQSPTPDKYTAVYNPKGANKHDVFLDMMHGMRHDPEYMELLNEFETATRNARGADMDYFFDQDAQEDPNFVIDGREQWDKNYIDGMVRAHMYKLASQEKHLPFVNPFGSKPHGTEDYEMELGSNSPEMYQAADQIYNYIKGDKRKNNSSLKKVKIKSLPRKNQ